MFSMLLKQSVGLISVHKTQFLFEKKKNNIYPVHVLGVEYQHQQTEFGPSFSLLIHILYRALCKSVVVQWLRRS